MKKHISIENSKKAEKVDIWIGSGLLTESWVVEQIASMATSCVMIIDERADMACLDELKSHCELCLTIPGGESVKDVFIYESLLSSLIEQEIGSDSVIIGCGGGALLDLVGFLSATYCRGVKLCLIPSTLLAMTDAAIGGKNGLNIDSIKNVVGTLHHPEAVFIDVDFLDTLPSREMNNGLVEMAKHALLDGKEACERFEQNIESIKAKNKEVLIVEIFESIAVKKHFVEASYSHFQRRHLLNFGHTIGHAIESLENFSCSHGEAVAMGILVESLLANRLSILPEEEYEYIERLIMSLQVPMGLSRSFSIDEWLEVLKRDKKSAFSQPRFVLPKGVGRFVDEEGECVVGVSHQLLSEVIKEL